MYQRLFLHKNKARDLFVPSLGQKQTKTSWLYFVAISQCHKLSPLHCYIGYCTSGSQALNFHGCYQYRFCARLFDPTSKWEPSIWLDVHSVFSEQLSGDGVARSALSRRRALSQDLSTSTRLRFHRCQSIHSRLAPKCAGRPTYLLIWLESCYSATWLLLIPPRAHGHLDLCAEILSR